MGNFRPVPLDQLPIPQAAAPPQYQPANLTPVPTEQPPGAGNMGKGGQIADIGANFLNGWLKGKQMASQKKLQQAQQSVEGAQYAFQISQQNASQVANDPNATPEAKQKAEQSRQQTWKAYLDVAQQYTIPEKTSGKKGGAKGAVSAIGEHMKNAFGTEDPHMFSQATLALLRTTGPPAIQGPSAQEQMAQRDLKNAKGVDDAIDNLTKARQGGNPDEIAKAEQKVRDVQGQIKPEETPQQKLQNSMAQATMDYQAGKPINEQTKGILEANGYLPKPVAPNIFLQTDNKGYLYSVSVDPQTGKATKGAQPIMKERVPPDARQEAQGIFEENLKQVGTLLKQAHPDWTDQQINQAKADAVLSKEFGIKPLKSPKGMTPKDAQSAVSGALNEVINSNMLSDEEKQGMYSVVSNAKGVGKGGWMFNKDLASQGFFDRYMYLGGKEYHGLSKEEANTLDARMRTLTRQTLRTQHPDWDEDTINELVPASMSEDASRFAMSPTPDGGAGGKQKANKADVQAFADQNNMSYGDAVKAVEGQGFDVEK